MFRRTTDFNFQTVRSILYRTEFSLDEIFQTSVHFSFDSPQVVMSSLDARSTHHLDLMSLLKMFHRCNFDGNHDGQVT